MDTSKLGIDQTSARGEYEDHTQQQVPRPKPGESPLGVGSAEGSNETVVTGIDRTARETLNGTIIQAGHTQYEGLRPKLEADIAAKEFDYLRRGFSEKDIERGFGTVNPQIKKEGE